MTRRPSSMRGSGPIASTARTEIRPARRAWRPGSPSMSSISTGPWPSRAVGSGGHIGCWIGWSRDRITAGSTSRRATSRACTEMRPRPSTLALGPPPSAGGSRSPTWRCSVSPSRVRRWSPEPRCKRACAVSTRPPCWRSRARPQSRSPAPGPAASWSPRAAQRRTTSAPSSGAIASPSSPSATEAATCWPSAAPSTATCTSGGGAGPRRRPCWTPRSRTSPARARRWRGRRSPASRSCGGGKAGRARPRGCWIAPGRPGRRSCAEPASHSTGASRARR
jgi:hypothetical protein